jgi:hypothetical protein
MVVLEFHPSATAKALLPPPEFTINVCLGDGDTSWQPGNIGNQRFAMRLACGEKTEHPTIVTEAAPFAFSRSELGRKSKAEWQEDPRVKVTGP